MGEKPFLFEGTLPLIKTKIKQATLDGILNPKILETICLYPHFDDKNRYILHIYPSSCNIEVFDKKDEGTLMSFQEDTNVWDPSSYILPVLYGKDKKGKERMWKVWVVKNILYKTYGETRGAKTPSFRSFKGMNIGKKNATTPEEQAKREAERNWVKQLDKDYHAKTKEGIELEKKVMAAKKKQGGVNINIDEILRGRGSTDFQEIFEEDENDSATDILPMHCQEWNFENKCLKYFDFDSGVYIQPKLDGVRCLAKIVNGEVNLLSRRGKKIVWLDHIRKDIKSFLKGKENVYLDGEIYAEKIINYSPEDGGEPREIDVKERFDTISGAARPKRNKPHPYENQLCFYVFDIADPSGQMNQDARFAMLDDLFSSRKSKHIKRVKTLLIYSSDLIRDYYDEYAQEGFEGVIIRDRELYYEQKRSLKMRKYKEFIDEEFPIVDAVCDEGVDTENFRWVCEKLIIYRDKNKKEIGRELCTFKVKPMGTREQRREWYENSNEYIGKLLNVRYQHPENDENDKSDKVPRFPRGIEITSHIRDYD